MEEDIRASQKVDACVTQIVTRNGTTVVDLLAVFPWFVWSPTQYSARRWERGDVIDGEPIRIPPLSKLRDAIDGDDSRAAAMEKPPSRTASLLSMVGLQSSRNFCTKIRQELQLRERNAALMKMTPCPTSSCTPPKPAGAHAVDAPALYKVKTEKSSILHQKLRLKFVFA